MCRSLLLELGMTGIDAVRGDRLVAAAARELPPGERLQLIAVGKAAAAMAAGARRSLGKRVARTLVITKEGHVAPWSAELKGAEVIEAGHPLPTAASLRAGERLLAFIREAGEEAEFLLLISGGTSSLLEAPVEGVDLETLQRVNRWLLGSGLDIAQLNAVRRRISRIKGGNLLQVLGGRTTRVWLISDVPGDDPAVIGSGPCYPPPSPDAGGEPAYPDWLAELLQRVPRPPAIEGPVPEHRILGNLDMACRAVVEAARQGGHAAHYHRPELDGDAEQTGLELAARLAGLPPGVHVWGGETTVRLPPDPGRGGRNQQLALAAATVLAGSEGRCMLAIGTDGTDGPTEDAGALVDGGTLARGEAEGLSAAEHLRRADAGRFLEASGDLVSTGPTGTNVRDLLLAMKE